MKINLSSRELRTFFDKHGCDKGSRHGYEIAYVPIISRLLAQHGYIKLLEIGVFKGSSAIAFADYFEHCQIPYHILGLDVFTRESLNKVTSRLNSYPNIKFMKLDSQNVSLQDIRKVEEFSPNLIIDDAEHTPEANTKTLKNFYHTLIENSSYCIEDVFPDDVLESNVIKSWWLNNNKAKYNSQKFKSFHQCLGSIKKCNIVEYDNRKSHQPESFIYEIQKGREKSK